MLLHGFLCDSRCWRAQLAGLADDFKVVAWDAPGAGASPDPDEPFTITDWAHALADFLDAVGITRTHLLGLSWGGMLAQELFRLHPSRVDRLLLADTYAGWKGSLPQEAVEQRRARCYRDALRPAREVVSEWVPKDFFVNASPELAAEMAGWGEGDARSPLSVAEQFHAAIRGSELRVIPGAGHVSNMEKPEDFNARVLEFLLRPVV